MNEHTSPHAAAELLATVRGLVLDMDGVLWRGDEPLPGLVPFFEFIQVAGLPYMLATNNSSKLVATYVQKLARMGVRSAPEHIISAATATAAYLQTHADRFRRPGANGTDRLRIHVVGGEGLRAALSDAGFLLVDGDDGNDGGADVVVAGLDWDITYQKLYTATRLIRAGAHFIGTNPDRTYPMPDGLAPGAGSLLAALEASTDQAPLVVGKPEPIMFQMALARMGTPAAQTLMIGDRLGTDILGAQRAGLRTALVLTGVSTEADLAADKAENEAPPDLVFSGLADLLAAWQAIQA